MDASKEKKIVVTTAAAGWTTAATIEAPKTAPAQLKEDAELFAARYADKFHPRRFLSRENAIKVGRAMQAAPEIVGRYWWAVVPIGVGAVALLSK